MNEKIGFIGLGKMAKAIIGGILRQNKNALIYGFDPNNSIDGVTKLASNIEVVQKSDIIFFCTKPFVIRDVFEEIKGVATDKKLFVSIAAGISLSIMEEYLGQDKRLIRVMPNTPALVAQGACVVVKGRTAAGEDVEKIKNILSNIGIVIEQTEDKIDAITALSGSGPAYYYYIIDAMAKSAQKLGLDYETALKLSAQAALGSAKMIMEAGMSVDDLITAVTTPGGCTAVGNDLLNNSNITEILDETIEKTAQKAFELGKK